VVIVAEGAAHEASCTALVTDNPYLGFARAAALLHPRRSPGPGVHTSAVVDPASSIDPTASIGPLCVIESDVEIGAGAEIGPGCVVRSGSRIGAGSRLVARVTVCEGSLIGERVLLHPGAVIGREGFGFAKEGDHWVRIPQLGRVRIGDDAEVGANSTVDRGAIDDTIIGAGVKIDNLIQIGHNVQIGENTAMAACSGISGSTRIGRRCTIAGAVGMAGHLDIGDDVHFTGMAMVTRSFPEPGQYSSGIPAMPSADWRRNIARFRHLDELVKRVKRLEDQLAQQPSLSPTETGD
jgi:UDP-3-O-[3-hydroxymyristoyl] glucosamine N-acyltransferase